MSWQKHFQKVPNPHMRNKAIENQLNNQSVGGSGTKFASYLPEVYSGAPNRIERYQQYENMDQDPEVFGALSTIADFCTQREERTQRIFDFKFKGEPNDAEVAALKIAIEQWISLNEFDRRIWRIFRNTIKYGDQFFIRDPETLVWHWVDPGKVEKVIIDETGGKKPGSYVFSDLDLNLQTLTATFPENVPNANGTPNVSPERQYKGAGGRGNNSRFSGANPQGSIEVAATHVVHLSLSEGLDANWPFGNSILESVFKVFKQKELLEDAIIIYRVQRAPERRVFYVDVGAMPPHRAAAYLERIKNEIHQRRIPNRSGGGTNIMDAAYNPISMLEDYFFTQTSEGRGSRVETLPGGENLGQIDDLKYFNNKLIRGLGVPSAYLPTGPEDGQQVFSDGRVGTAYMQENSFAQRCSRLQGLLQGVFDAEFKLFLKQRGLNIDSSIFELIFNPPQHMGDYAQIERDSAYVQVYQQLAEVKYFSKRFLQKRFLGLTDEEINENITMWKEENKKRVEKNLGLPPSELEGGGSVGASEVGLRPGDDLDSGGDDAGMDDMGGDMGGDTGGDAGGMDLGGDAGGGSEPGSI